MAQLINAMRKERRKLLQLLRVRARRTADDLFLSGWALLARLGNEHPAELDRVLQHPYVQAWAEHCLRGGDTAALPPEAAHLAAITAAAAIRTGAPAEVTVPVSEGYVHLPTLGRLRVGEARTAEITIGGNAFQVRTRLGKWDVHLDAADLEADWEPVRELRSGGFAVRLEDTDPYRDCHQWPAAPRLSAADAARWQQLFAVAWPLIESHYPAYAAGIEAGLTTLMPMAEGPGGRNISAAARQAFGAVGLALPADGETLAQLLIHEFQHVKLGAVIDLADLYDQAALHDQAGPRLFYAPWRDDPRPLPGLLQGTYAHIGVTDYWRGRRDRAAGAEAVTAAEQFARWRLDTAEAIETLAGSGSLTDDGDHFVALMRATVHPWLDEPVDDAAIEAAVRRAAEHREAWQQRELS